MKQLFGFERVKLAPGESKSIFFDSPAHVFATVDSKVLSCFKPVGFLCLLYCIQHHVPFFIE